MYQVRVLGNFPSQADRRVVPLHEVETAQQRELPAPTSIGTHRVIACDVARFGDDETVIGTGSATQVRIRERTFNGKDTTVTYAAAPDAPRARVRSRSAVS
jgi:hypothetical protein